MSTQVDGDGPLGAGKSAGRGDAVRRRVGVQGLIAVVACCAAIFWAWRSWWDQGHPLLAAARGLGSGDPARRVEAVREVSDLGFGHGGESIRLLIPALKDDDASVRAAAAGSLGLLGSNAIGMGTGADDVRSATAALIERLKDPDARVRAAVTTSVAVIATAANAPRPEGRNPPAVKKASAPLIDVDAVAAVLEGALDGADAPVRQAVITGLGAWRRSARRAAAGPHQGPGRRVGRQSVGGGHRAGPLPAWARPGDPALAAAPGRRRIGGPRSLPRGPGEDPARGNHPGRRAAIIAALHVPDRSARLGVVALVGRLELDSRAAVPALIAVLREPVDSDAKAGGRGDTDESDSAPAQAAARALGEVAPGTPQAGEAMAALLDVVRSGPARRRGPAAEGRARSARRPCRPCPP